MIMKKLHMIDKVLQILQMYGITDILKRVLHFSLESFRFDYEYVYDYEIRHFWRQLLASSPADMS